MSSITAGTTSTTTLVHSGDTTGSLVFKTNDTGSGGTTAVTIDTSQNVGIGTTSPVTLKSATTLQVLGNIKAGNANGAGLISLGDTASNGANAGIWRGAAGAYGSTGNYLNLGGYDGITFTTGNAEIASQTERMRIDSSGNLLVGTTSQLPGSTSKLVVDYATGDFVAGFRNSNASPLGLYVFHSTDVNGGGNPFIYCVGGLNVRFSLRSNGGLANFSANNVNLSDRREKTNFAPAKSYLNTICSIPVQTFNYIDQSEDDPGLTLGVVAQDVQAVAPEMVTESNWGTEEAPKMRLSIYQTDLQYALMKSIQELKAINDQQAETINALTARVVALEGQ